MEYREDLVRIDGSRQQSSVAEVNWLGYGFEGFLKESGTEFSRLESCSKATLTGQFLIC